MDYSSSSEVVQLGREAAREVAGEDANVKVELEIGVDSTELPAYLFFITIRKGKQTEVPDGLVRTRIGQHLADKLLARGDIHVPIIRTLILSDWENSPVA